MRSRATARSGFIADKLHLPHRQPDREPNRAYDRRFGWSTVPASVSLFGDAFFVLSYLAIVRVFRENTFAASTIAVEPGQKLISTGPHAHVRHPMYAAGILLLAASPLSFGSWWGLTVFIPLFWRLLDEERFLTLNLAGYADYCRQVRYRLIPGIW